MKDKVKIITVAFTIAFILAIPMLNEYANTFRTEPRFGGECIMWMLPGLLYLLYLEYKEMKEDWKNI